MGRRVLLFVALAVLAGAGLAALFLRPAPRPNVLLLVLDTLRADHVGAYGYPAGTTPHLDAFAAEFNRCAYAVATAPWTPASVASILSGAFVTTHGYMPPRHAKSALRKNFRLAHDLALLPEVLRDHGYATAAFSSNAWVVEELGFGEGFDRFVYRNGVRANVVTHEARALLRSLKKRGKPFFLYLHYLDPHDPYHPPKAHRIFKPDEHSSRYSPALAEAMARYDGEIHFLDSELGRLFGLLKSEGLFDGSMIFIVADHGEQFMEHGFRFHGNQVYNTEAHVPLLFKLAHGRPRGRVIEHTVSTIDIYATVLAELGIALPQQARLSLPLFAGPDRHIQRGGVFTAMAGKLRQRAFTRHDGRKLLIGSNVLWQEVETHDPARRILGVFDARRDYFEEHALDAPDTLTELQESWRVLAEQAQAIAAEEVSAEGAVSEETIKQIKSLGYLN